MAADVEAARLPELSEQAVSRSVSGPLLRLKSAGVDRDRQYADSLSRRRRVLNITTWMAAAVCASFAVIELMTSRLYAVALINAVTALARLALNLADAANGLTDHDGQKVPIRIGLAVGPVVAGVIGTSRFFYDVWGDAVNVASRMESTGVEGRIQVPPDAYERLKREFVFENRGDVVVKGKGVLNTWFLVGQRATESVPG